MTTTSQNRELKYVPNRMYSKDAAAEARETREVAIRTAEELDDQGRRIAKAGRSAAEINDDLNVTERLIRDNRKKQAHAEDEIDEEIANSSAAREAAKWAAQKEEFKSKFHSTKSLKSKTGIEEYDDYMEETDRDLDDIADSIADIKELALGMRVSLHKDMAHLDRTVAEVERANDRTKKQRMKIESMK